MDSVRRKSRRKDVLTDFLKLKDSSPSLAQTGPKRRKGGVHLTPVTETPLPSRGKGIPLPSRGRGRGKGHSEVTPQDASRGRGGSRGVVTSKAKRKALDPQSADEAQVSDATPRATFLDLKNASLSLAETGPKRRKGGYALTPIQTTPLRTESVKRSALKQSTLVRSMATPTTADLSATTPTISLADPISTSSKVQSVGSKSQERHTPVTKHSTLALVEHHFPARQSPTPQSLTTEDRHRQPSHLHQPPVEHHPPALLPPAPSSLHPSSSHSAEHRPTPTQPSSGDHAPATTPHQPHSPAPTKMDLEPLGSGEEEEEEEETEGEGEPRMTTPRLQDMTSVSYHSDDGGEEEDRGVEGASDSRLVPKKRGRLGPRKQPADVKKKPATLPRSLIKNLFSLYSKKRLTRGAMDLVLRFCTIYLQQASEDLVVYSHHAGRKSITVDDVVLLLKRQRVITENQSFEYLVNTYLPMEYAEELLPCVFR